MTYSSGDLSDLKGCNVMVTTALFMTLLLSVSDAVETGTPPLPDQILIYQEGARGELDYMASNPCELYFHVPVVYGSQVPISLSVEAPHLVDYRFIRMENNNVLCVARMNQGSGILTWKSCVAIVNNTWDDIPASVPIPDPSLLPDTVTAWLTSTDCCQLNSPYVMEAAETTSAGVDDAVELASNVEEYVGNIPWAFPHNPTSFDAHYAIRWGNSCTGHAHAAAALFRAGGLPSRGLLNIPTIYGSSPFDHHWIVDYFIPDYGWVMAESGSPTVPPRGFIVTFVLQPYHEFPAWYSNAIDGLWHSSSPFIPTPDWGQGHTGYHIWTSVCDEDTAEVILSLGAELWDMHTTYTGQILTPEEAELRSLAETAMYQAYDSFNSRDFSSYITNAGAAVSLYQSISLPEIEVFYSEDFESGPGGWTHGGIQDQWELGSPLSGPDAAYSGTSCWGTDLSGNYQDNADCWLLSPVIDLDNRSCAELSFWIWNDIEDLNWQEPDKFFVELSRVGEIAFTPISDCIVGVNNDPEIVSEGGWTKVVLDLREYITGQVQFRFTLTSNGSVTYPGAYIDDVQVSGRYKDLTGISNGENFGSVSVTCSPNPCSNSTSISINTPGDGTATVSVYNIAGRRIATPSSERITGGTTDLPWDCRDDSGNRLPAGVYIVRVETQTGCSTAKVVITAR